MSYMYYSVCLNIPTHVYSYHEFTSKRAEDKFFKFKIT
jgi:hypothetical protein